MVTPSRCSVDSDIVGEGQLLQLVDGFSKLAEVRSNTVNVDSRDGVVSVLSEVVCVSQGMITM